MKKNITPNKKINGKISNTIEGIFKIVNNWIINRTFFCLQNILFPQKYLKKLKNVKTKIIIKIFFKNNLVKYVSYCFKIIKNLI